MSSCKLEKDYTKDDDTDNGHNISVGTSSPASCKRVKTDCGATPESLRKSIPEPRSSAEPFHGTNIAIAVRG